MTKTLRLLLRILRQRAQASLVLCGLLLSAATFAANVNIAPTQQGAAVGSKFSIDVVGNFVADATLGGGIDVFYDESVLEFVSFTHSELGEAQYRRDPSESPGQLSGIAFGVYDGLSTQAIIGDLQFNVLPSAVPGSSTIVTVAASTGVAGPFASGDGPYTQQSVEFLPGQVDIIILILDDGFESE